MYSKALNHNPTLKRDPKPYVIELCIFSVFENNNNFGPLKMRLLMEIGGK